MSDSDTLAAHALLDLVAQEPGAGDVALREPPPGLLLHWYGPPPTGVLADLAEQHPDVEVEVVPMERSPEELSAVQGAVLEDFADRGVGCVAATSDGSALKICVDHLLAEDEQRAVAEDVGRETGLPTTVLPGGNPVALPGRP